MTLDLSIRYLHFLSILVLFATVFGQFASLRRSLRRREIARLASFDAVYGLAALGVLATGFLQWFAVGKPADFYSHNPISHGKITLFLVIGLLSIYPSVFLAREKRGPRDDIVKLPALLRWTVRVEFLFLVLMPLLATLMARGIGYVTPG